MTETPKAANLSFFIEFSKSYLMELVKNQRCGTCKRKIAPTKGIIIEREGVEHLIFFCGTECYDNYEQQKED